MKLEAMQARVLEAELRIVESREREQKHREEKARLELERERLVFDYVDKSLKGSVIDVSDVLLGKVKS